MIHINFICNSFNINDIPTDWRQFIDVNSGESSMLVSFGIIPDDSSYRYRALMQPRTLMLKFSLPFFFEFPVGSSVVYEGERYYVKLPEDIKKKGERNIEYSMLMYADDSVVCDYKMRNTVDGRLKWSMCARPHEFIEEIVKNLNQRTGTTKYKVGSCLESTEKTVEFNHTYIDAALADIATAFESEYEITSDCTINLRKVEYFKDEPLPLSYGRGNGFVPGVGRTSNTDGAPVKRLYAQGGERNINRTTYGEMLGLTDKPGDLLLPLSKTVSFDGTHFEGDDGFNADIAHTYQSDAHGYYIERIDKTVDATKDDSLDCSGIYPSRVGKCTDLVTIDTNKNLYDFVDNTIPADLDFNSYLIPGETMTVIFQSGMLSGNDREFEVKYYHNSVNGKSARRFEIVPQEIDGITMPNETFKPNFGENGDTYAVFGIQLPKEYICNDTDKSGASWDMMREAARKLFDCEEQKFTFTGELQSMWAKRNWENIGGKLVVGGYVWFTDNQFAPNGTAIRIIGIKDFLTNPYAPTIELSNSITSPGSVSSSLRQIDNTEIVIDNAKREAIRFTKRRFRDALETIGMLEDAQLENFNSAISPVAIQTMSMLVGDESLQFLMGKTIATIGCDDWEVTFKDNELKFPAGYLRHMTLGNNSISSNRDQSQCLTWEMPERLRTPDSEKKYYVYAVVNRSGFSFNAIFGSTLCNTSGEWVIDDVSHKIDEDPNKYYLLVGILNSEYNGERSFVSLYGFTEILPGRITADRIVSSNGRSYFDMANNEFNFDGLLKLTNTDGLWLKSKIQLGILNQNNIPQVLVGLNGAYSSALGGRTPAAWFGGNMVDLFDVNDTRVRPVPSDAAKSIIRMDGSSYFANGNVGFRKDGSGWFGGENGIVFDNQGAMTFGNGIKINIGNGGFTTLKGISESVESLVNFMNNLSNNFIPLVKDANGALQPATWGEITTTNPLAAVKSVKGFYSESFISAMGANPDGSSGSGASQLRMLDDVLITDSVLVSGQSLVFNGTKWVNQTLNQGLNTSELADYLSSNSYAKQSDIPSLSGYATETWVTGKNYLTGITKSMVENVLTGDITSHSHKFITFIDRRSVNPAPFDTTFSVKGVEYGIKYNGTDGLNENNSSMSYHSVMTLHPWGDRSGCDAFQIGFSDSGNIYQRHGRNDWGNWRQFAFTDSNVASASKLNTSRKIWGQDFDGSGDVNGTLHLYFNGTPNYNDGIRLYGSAKDSTWSGINFGCNPDSIGGVHVNQWVLGRNTSNEFIISKGNATGNAIYITNDLKIGFGTTNPSEKVDVNGTVKVQSIKIGDCTITWDATAGGLKFNKGIYSEGFVSAIGANSSGSSGSGVSYSRLDSWDDYTSDKSGYVLSALLGNDLNTRLNNVYGKSTVDSMLANYQPKGNYVTTDTTQTISAQKTFTYNMRMVAALFFKNPDVDLGIYINPTAGGHLYFMAHTNYGYNKDIGYIHRDGYAVFSKFIKSGGTASQFLKADGSVDSNAYVNKSGDTMTGPLTIKCTNDNKLVFDNTDADNQSWISFRQDGAEYSSIRATSEKFVFSKYIRAPYFEASTDTLCSNLNADLLDGVHDGSVTSKVLRDPDYHSQSNRRTSANVNFNNDAGLHFFLATSNMQEGKPTASSHIIHGEWDNSLAYASQLALPVTGGNVEFRYQNENSVWQSWQKLAFITDNVASATKLADNTSRTAWGQTFFTNGKPASISGKMTNVGTIEMKSASYIYAPDSAGKLRTVIDFYSDQRPTFAYGFATAGVNVEYCGYNIHLKYGKDHNTGLTLTKDGLLKVISSSDLTSYNQGIRLYGSAKDSTWSLICFGCDPDAESGTHDNQWLIGRTDNNHFVIDKSGYDGTHGLVITSGYNVGIGKSTADYKLDVVGVIRSTVGIFSNGYVSAMGQNTSSDARLKNISGDYVMNIRDIANAPTVEFKWKSNGKRDIGSIAQYWQRINPLFTPLAPDETLTLQYGKVALLASKSIAMAVVSHDDELRRLKAEIKRLNNRIAQLEKA